MAIVSFWSEGKEETGKTSAIIALSTYMAIEHNYKILVVSTSYNDDTMKNAFWKETKLRRNLGLFGPNTNAAMQNGIEGLNRFVHSNKVTPDIITNYTKIVFKDRLEYLLGYDGERKKYEEECGSYPSIIDLANKYYDLVFVDIDSELDEGLQKEILDESDIIIVTMTQKLSKINRFDELRQENEIFNSNKILLLIGRYDKYSKYTSKNITRYLREKNEINTMPYNSLFFAAYKKAGVPDLFLRLKGLNDDTDRNTIFIKEIKRLSDNIIYRLQELQMKRM